MKCLEKHVRLVIAVLVLVIVMLSIALWSSSYINRIDDYYFNEYLNEADTLEWVSYDLQKRVCIAWCIVLLYRQPKRGGG